MRIRSRLPQNDTTAHPQQQRMSPHPRRAPKKPRSPYNPRVLFADKTNRRAAYISGSITALVCVIVFLCFFAISSMTYLASLSQVEPASASNISVATRGKHVTIDDTDGLLMDSGYEVTDYERTVANKVWEQIKRGQTRFDLIGMELDDAKRIIKAAGLSDAPCGWRNIQLPLYHAVYWEVDEPDVRDMADEHKLALAALKSAGVTEGMSAFGAVQLINGYVTEHVVYDDTLERHSAADAFQGLAVCSGYAEMFRLMCECANIPCSYVRGTADGNAHAWNAVQLEGHWYYIDVTWNDSSGDAYYLSDVLWDDHQLDEGQVDLMEGQIPIDTDAKTVSDAKDNVTKIIAKLAEKAEVENSADPEGD